MKSALRYLRIYRALLRFSFSRMLEFRFDFFFRFIMDIIYYAVNIGFFKILYLHTDTLGSWNEQQAIVFIALAMVLDGLYMTVIARNIWELPQLINKGELDFLLTRPASPLFFLTLRNFEFSSLLNFLTGLGVLTYALAQYEGELSIWNLLLAGILLLNGLLIYVCLRLFSVLPVFWTHDRFGFNMLFDALSRISERPEVIFRGLTHLVLVTIIPFLVITSFPARAIFSEIGVWGVTQAFLVTLMLCLAVKVIWNRGLKVYSSASS